MSNEPLNIAVIGSGVAGLTAAHILQRKHQVTLIEKNNILGGHTNTVVLPDGPDEGTPVDTGFIVMNHRNYPLLTQLLKQLDVPLRDSDMSFGYHDQPSGLQYCGSGIDGLFAQRKNIISPAFHRMVKDTFRFFNIAKRDLEEHNLIDETLAEYVVRHQFGKEFIDWHLVPMGSAIWSTPCDEMMQFPARSFLQFFKNHGLLSLNDRPQWRTVVGGSCAYIRKMQSEWRNVSIKSGISIAGISRTDNKATVHYDAAESGLFDEVIIATHADQALNLLNDPSAEEKSVLAPWHYTSSRTVLHTDESVMPPLKKVWSSWNFRRIQREQTSLTYHMNRLQGLNTQKQYFVSLNLPEAPQGIVAEFNYTHPMYTREALTSQDQLKKMNGENHTWFAGSYFGNGFHEDAVRSAVEVAKGLGMNL